ncbi:MAG: hypothetical protein LBQ48_03265, partial [Oscillospiraceae bacterium]|nr:hypothetical protein [Oscillospiraceae bacterium]
IREAQTDNGTEWTMQLLVKDPNSRTLFEQALEDMDIIYHRIRVATPRHNGKRYSIYGDSEEDIDTQLLVIEASIKSKTHTEESGMALKDWLTLWLERYAKSNVRFPTYLNYKGAIENHIIPQIGYISLRSLDGSKLQKFFNDKSKGGRKDGGEGGK